ncbi:MAG: hypothetical protein AAFV53_02760 [Myxococcota bacterium]
MTARWMLAASLVGALVGCEPGEDVEDTAATAEIDCSARRPALTYDNYGEAFMIENCAGCHSSLLPLDLREGAPPGVELNTYADVVFWAERIEARALGEAPDMPPGGGLSDGERDRLHEWLTCEVYVDAARLDDENNQ